MKQVFVTGATGLLGNNLVRALLAEGVAVTALVRNKSKAEKLFKGLSLHVVEGDICMPESYRTALQGCDGVFHTAAFFRDNFKGGKHWQTLYDTNVKGTADLFAASWEAGIRKIVHTSSIAVLDGDRNQLIDESMSRSKDDKDDYYRSKILSEDAVRDFLDKHPDMFACFVLPGWMYGPGDIGPTSSGQFILDFMHNKLPGVLPASFSVVDARDVAAHHILAMKHGRRGERYLAAGQHMTMGELMQALAEVSGQPAPKKPIPLWVLRMIARFYELYHRISGKPILLSQSSVNLMAREYLRTHFSHDKSERELGGTFRPVEQTLSDVVHWYRQHGYL